jgi:hypothetical protein
LGKFCFNRRLKIFQSGMLLPLVVFMAVFILVAFVVFQALVYP